MKLPPVIERPDMSLQIPLPKLITDVLRHNQYQVKRYLESMDKRRVYRSKFKVRIRVFICMDGRLNFDIMTETPLGVMQSERNIGARNDLSYDALNVRMREFVQSAIDAGEEVLLIITYHDDCRGWDYCAKAAEQNAMTFATSLREAFYGCPVSVVVMGIMTHRQQLVLHHGVTLERVVTTGELPRDRQKICELARMIYPDCPTSVQENLAELIVGNVRHIGKIKGEHKKLTHNERVLCIGNGFDWLHRRNYELILKRDAPESECREATRGAWGLLFDNLDNNRISKEDRLLLYGSEVYDNSDWKMRLAIPRARRSTALGLSVLEEHFPQRRHQVHVMTGVTNWYNREVTLVDDCVFAV